MNLIIRNKDIYKIEDELFNKVEYMSNNNFCNCFMSLQPSDKFYSPFILALIGIFLNQTKQIKFEPILTSIENKLNETSNSYGIYNFYGDDQYFFDVDTTSIVNTFFLLKQSKSLEYHEQIINSLKNNRMNGTKAIQTWINRPRNNVDWFVNYNFYTYTHIYKKPDLLIEDYLLNEQVDFLKNGSHYYSNIHFPSFITKFNEKEFNLNLSFNKINISRDDTNLFDFGLNILNDIFTEINFDKMLKLYNSNQVYFNSKKGYFSSQELNAAILLYITNKIKNHEQHQ